MGFSNRALIIENAKRKHNDPKFLNDRGEERKKRLEEIKKKYGGERNDI